MTTDKTPATLATAKHGGCVQLGGSASQIDVDTLWWLQDAANTLAEGGNESHAAKLHELHAALSAQPSPGGQGDALLREVSAQLESLDCGACIGSDAPMEDLHGRIAAHLAARQPVAPTLQQISDYLHGLGEIKRAVIEREALAARQPVGEPVAFRVHYLSGKTGEVIETGKWCDAPVPSFIDESVTLFSGNTQRLELAYSGPPARAVDLGAVRDAVRGITLGFDGDLPYIKGIAEALALIDSQAVGK